MSKKSIDKPVQRTKTIQKEDTRLKTMTVGDQTYSVGDVGWYVDERTTLTRVKIHQGELTGLYPDDSTEPAVGLTDFATGKYRAIRARLIGFSKKEAKDNYDCFLKSEKKKD